MVTTCGDVRPASAASSPAPRYFSPSAWVNRYWPPSEFAAGLSVGRPGPARSGARTGSGPAAALARPAPAANRVSAGLSSPITPASNVQSRWRAGRGRRDQVIRVMLVHPGRPDPGMQGAEESKEERWNRPSPATLPSAGPVVFSRWRPFVRLARLGECAALAGPSRVRRYPTWLG